MGAAEFSRIAQYLGNPLVLVGFALMLVFGIHKQLLKAGILPKLEREDTSTIIRLLLGYGFWLGLATLLLGLGLQFFRDWIGVAR